MNDLLFLAHRIPYPPDKGEKIRAWHMLRHFARGWRLHVGCFVDDPADAVHVPTLATHCAELLAVPIDRRRQRVKALLQTRPGRSLSEAYFADPRLAQWVHTKLSGGIRHAFVYCSAMAPYLAGETGVRRVLDMVDVDSEKWREYAARTAWPMRAVWAREARTVLALERRAAVTFDRTLLVSEAERARFAILAPETASRLAAVDNGVDLARFSPDLMLPDMYEPGERRIVFTGTMDYWPNVDAVTWFVAEMLPRIRTVVPAARLTVVGSNPAPAIVALAGPAVRVTGRVEDVRPWLRHAEVAIAPLRIARGIQNKVLEAAACGRPIVATGAAFEGIRAVAGRDLLVADDSIAFAEATIAVLQGAHPGLGAAARDAMRSYGWAATLAPLDAIMTGTT